MNNNDKLNRKLKMCFTYTIFFSFFLFLFSTKVIAMIREISLEELVRKSDVIAIVDVLAIKEVGTLPSGATLIANLVKVDQPLMGGAAIGERLKLKTRGIEDNAVFKKGLRTLLFLKKVDNYYEVVSGIAGSWPVTKDGRLVGYGTGKKLSEVEKAIEDFERDKKTGKYKPDTASGTKKVTISI